MITYSFGESGILLVKLSGKVSFEDIKKYLSEFETISIPTKDLLSLYDLRDADLELKLENITFISDWANKISASFRIVRTAFLVNKPDITAYTILFKNSASKEIAREVFSTREVAVDWLKRG